MRAMLLVGVMLAGAGCTQSAALAPSNGTWRLSGIISSTTGGPLVGARLTVQNGANKDTQVTSDSSGYYAFASLQSGRFTVSIEAPGFVSVSPVVDLFRDIEANFALNKAQ